MDARAEQLTVHAGQAVALAAVDVVVAPHDDPDRAGPGAPGGGSRLGRVGDRLAHEVAHLRPGRRRALAGDDAVLDVDEVGGPGDAVVGPAARGLHDLEGVTGELAQRRHALLLGALGDDHEQSPAGHVDVAAAELVPERLAHAAAAGEEGEQGALAPAGHRDGAVLPVEGGAHDVGRAARLRAGVGDDAALDVDAHRAGWRLAAGGRGRAGLLLQLEPRAQLVEGLEDEGMAAQQPQDEHPEQGNRHPLGDHDGKHGVITFC